MTGLLSREELDRLLRELCGGDQEVNSEDSLSEKEFNDLIEVIQSGDINEGYVKPEKFVLPAHLAGVIDFNHPEWAETTLDEKAAIIMGYVESNLQFELGIMVCKADIELDVSMFSIALITQHVICPDSVHLQDISSREKIESLMLGTREILKSFDRNKSPKVKGELDFFSDNAGSKPELCDFLHRFWVYYELTQYLYPMIAEGMFNLIAKYKK